MQYEEIIEVDPKDILIGENIRTDVVLDDEFVASIKNHGVITPVTTYRLAEGEHAGRLELVWGQRRTLGAIKAGRATIPALVAKNRAEAEKTAKADRIIKQLVENDKRAGVNEADRAAAFEQLHLLGLSEKTIAKKVSTTQAQVEVALTVRADATATKALSEHPLTLDQAAALTEFSDDEEAVSRLIEAATEGGFDHVAHKERLHRVEREAVAARAADLAEQGVRVLDSEAHYAPETAELYELLDGDGKVFTEDSHAECEGHGAQIIHLREERTMLRWMCADWRMHGHQHRNERVTGPMTEEEKHERRELVATNKAWAAAEEVRREWLRTFLTRKTAPKDAAQHILRTTLASNYYVGKAVRDNNQLLAVLLGHDKPLSHGQSPILEAAEKATPARAQVLALGVVLAAVEAGLDRHSWRNPTREAADHLRALAGWATSWPTSSGSSPSTRSRTDRADGVRRRLPPVR
ncbi:ParB/RepB/Spo0J family partition protein [Jiangella alba]|uniref:Chromosome partitioning protein, ParB family n=1 Tax=Jiangella alba TaxID=561176 RepID=A0A1H5MY56_9ACTN|nr:ParB N-terminal domain-containing protein [Jiangella alba]SEE94292.1 chromosome partitioning protein, ParB family [Jiangella alba]